MNERHDFLWDGCGWYASSIEDGIPTTRRITVNQDEDPQRSARSMGLGTARYYNDKPEGAMEYQPSSYFTARGGPTYKF